MGGSILSNEVLDYYNSFCYAHNADRVQLTPAEDSVARGRIARYPGRRGQMSKHLSESPELVHTLDAGAVMSRDCKYRYHPRRRSRHSQLAGAYPESGNRLHSGWESSVLTDDSWKYRMTAGGHAQFAFRRGLSAHQFRLDAPAVNRPMLALHSGECRFAAL